MVLAAYFGLVLLSMIVLIGLSLRANQSLPPSDKLPMQWGFDGRPTWSVSRKIALIFTPSLYLMTALPIAFLLPLQWGPDVAAMLGALTFVAAGFVSAHIFHIWLIRRDGWHKKD